MLIVEGKHEKNELFGILFRCFPSICISMDDIWIYGTNIYMLYEDIVKEYGEAWEKDDIDLPFVISRKLEFHPLRYKEDFVNIMLVFDYERHDKNFSEEKILKMQRYFNDAADAGKLVVGQGEDQVALTWKIEENLRQKVFSSGASPGLGNFMVTVSPSTTAIREI